jgi:hypothetical protein
VVSEVGVRSYIIDKIRSEEIGESLQTENVVEERKHAGI